MRKYKIPVLLLLFALLLQLPAAAYFDVDSGAWYAPYVERLTSFEIINGYSDNSFRPDDNVKRGEFLKMICIAAEVYTDSGPPISHWAAVYWQMALEAELLVYDDTRPDAPLLQCTAAELDTPITRFEMAMLVNNTVSKAFFEPRIRASSPQSGIADYHAIPSLYKDAVVQVYGKGIITGFEDTSFRGGETLSRAEAAAVIVRLLWSNERKLAGFVTEVEENPVYDPGTSYLSFAFEYRTLSAQERRIRLFGSAEKTHFTSAADAAGYMVGVTVPVWRLGANGKYGGQETIYVHKLVAQEVRLIFHEIYNDPERFPIRPGSVGGARYTDALRHSWGCAIDINPMENYYCRIADGVPQALVGSHWRPGSDPYSIKPQGSVVKAFAKYGWGWGGAGWSGGYYDYMHFSILSTGG